MKKYFVLSFCLFLSASVLGQVADKQTYLSEFRREMQAQWPENRTLNIVFHGHSVPSGYFKTPLVNTLQAYPHQVLHSLKELYPYAVINVITTSIGGEHSEMGAKRFKHEVLNHHPDVLFIDYALNDRGLGLERSEKAWRRMVELALKQGIKVILMTPTPDLSEDILEEANPLHQHAEMIRRLAAEYNVGLIDSYRIFENKARQGEKMENYMSQVNHPNSAGHQCDAQAIKTWFTE